MKKNIKYIIYALATSLSFFIDIQSIYNELNYKTIFNNNIFVIAFCFLLIFSFYKKANNKKISKVKNLLSLLFSIMIIIGNSFIKIDSWDLVFGNIKVFLISLIFGFGYYVLFKNIFKTIDKYLESFKSNDNLKFKKFKKIINFIDNKPFLSSFIIIAIFWSIYFLAYYPVILSPDPNYQILQYFGVKTKYIQYYLDFGITITNHHPIFHTLLLGNSISIGRALLNDNFGLFIYSFIQGTSLALTLSYTIKFLKDNSLKIKSRLIILGIYCLVPMFGFYAVSAVKDTYYTCFIILYSTILFDYIKNKELSFKKLIFLFITTIFISLFRNNGYYLVFLSFPFIIFYTKKYFVKLLLLFIIFNACHFGYKNILLPYFNIPDSGKQEILSIPFQQTARYVKYYDNELTSEDKKIIDKVLDYDTLALRYNPTLSDNVKNYYNGNATNEDLKKYFKVWSNGLLKHPSIYIEATLNNIYGYLTPNSTKWYIHTSYNPVKEGNGQVIIDNSEIIGDHWPEIDSVVEYNFNNLSFLRKILKTYGEVFPYIPIIGLISNIGFNSWMLLILGAYLISTKSKKYLIVLIPAYITLLTCIAGPANTYFRYAMPYIFSMPMYIALVINIIKKT